MTARLNPRTWPLRVKVPVLVAGLVVAVAMVVSHVVLSRLFHNQEISLRRLTGAYLDGISTAVLPNLVRKDIWETFDVLDRAGRRYAGLHTLYVMVALPDATVLAASAPKTFPVGSPVPPALRERFGSGETLVIDEASSRAWVRRRLVADGVGLGTIYAEIDLSELFRERQDVLYALLGLNTLLALLFAAVGYLMARKMVEPVSLLTGHVERIRDGHLEGIPDEKLGAQETELGRLFHSFNAMARALQERKILAQRLAEEEKLALLGKLASGMAHEVNNPLGGMMNAVNTLRKHGSERAVRETCLGLLERGLTGISNVVRAALVTYKGAGYPVVLAARDLDDLRFLIHHETLRRRVRLSWRNDLGARLPVDGGAVRQAVLNLLLNACAASPLHGTVTFEARQRGETVAISVADQGPGLPADVAETLVGAGENSVPPAGSVGLGTWTVARLVAQMRGHVAVDTAPGEGTRVTIYLPVANEEALNAVA